jgi:hypothetical protein
LSFCWQTRSACTVRAIEAADRRPEASSPGAQLHRFGKAVDDMNWLPLGWAISIRQLLVPRSSAA